MTRVSRGTAVRLTVVGALLVLALPASASAQATRTWVSGVGDDANPCSRTAPCKTWAGAISKTASGGEMNALDDGGFGALTITKPITVDGGGQLASTLASGTTGINVNMNPGVTTVATDKVVLRNLDINGTGASGGLGTNTGLKGVNVIKARSVKIVNTDISNFTQSGVHFAPSNTNARLYVQNSRIHDNYGAGVFVAPPSSGSARASVRRSHIDENGCGLVASSEGGGGVGTNCGTPVGRGSGGLAVINAKDNTISDNTGGGAWRPERGCSRTAPPPSSGSLATR